MNIRYFIDDIKNNIDFYLRNKLSFSRKNYSEKSENCFDVCKNSNQKAVYDRLKEKYDFEILKNISQENFIQSLYFLNVFDKYFSKNLKDSCSILDIGSKNWYYAKSEYMYFRAYSKNIELDGIEIDSNRLCSNLYSRYEIAKYHTKNLLNTCYIKGDFLKHNKKYDRIIWILPFITEYPHIAWGLPIRYFKPEQMLKKAYDSLNNNGEILIINQGEKEYAIQQKLNNKLEYQACYFGEIEDVFDIFKNKRYCSIIKKS